MKTTKRLSISGSLSEGSLVILQCGDKTKTLQILGSGQLYGEVDNLIISFDPATLLLSVYATDVDMLADNISYTVNGSTLVMSSTDSTTVPL